MTHTRFIIGAALSIALGAAGCTGVRAVEVRPPVASPPGMVVGYGTERIRGDAERSRQSAYLKAVDDLLSHGPILVSKTVEDRTSVVNATSATRSLNTVSRLRASSMIEPSYVESGVEDGVIWVLVGATESEIDRGWRQFLAWRAEKIEQARKLYEDASGPDRVPRLKASFALLEECGAADDPSLLYHEVKAVLDSELTRIARLEELERETRRLVASGQLGAAEAALEQASKLGLDPSIAQQRRAEIEDRRREAAALIQAGDDFYRDAHYGDAHDRYQRAMALDRDNPGLQAKLAAADRERRQARSQTIRSTAVTLGVSAARAVSEYFEYKQEQERRKQMEAEKEQQEREREYWR